jgi:hypothetical protein
MKAPLININGNSKSDIETQLKNIVKALNNSIETISKCDYNNGRNAIDQGHINLMKAEKAEILNTLKSFKMDYIKMFKEIH